MDSKQDLRNAVQEMFSLDTPVAEPITEDKARDIQGALGLAAAAERAQRTTSPAEKQVADIAERFNTPPSPPPQDYDRSAFVKSLTEKKDTPPPMSDEELNESRKTFDKISSSGKTLGMMLDTMFGI